MRVRSPAMLKLRYALMFSVMMLGFFAYSFYTRPLSERTSLFSSAMPLLLGQRRSSNDYESQTDGDVWQRSEQRLRHLHQECAKSNRSLSHGAQLYDHLHVDIQRKILYCYVPKVACTSWKRIFLKIIGLSPPTEDINSISRVRVHTTVPLLSDNRFKEDRDEILKTYRKFLFVRHPFDRVLAAYKDKLLHKDEQSRYDFHKQVGKQIEQTLQRPSTNGHNVTFSDFMEWLTLAGNHPSTEQSNEHWVSVHELCSPCSVRYDFLGKYETLSPDAAAVLDWLQVTDIVAKFPAADRPSNAGHFDPYFYGQLSDDVKRVFVNKYHDDFIPFLYRTLPDSENQPALGQT